MKYHLTKEQQSEIASLIGQNKVRLTAYIRSQFKDISDPAGITAIAVTKLDGTAKGGIVIAVSDALQIPVKFVGVGEQADDLMPFEPEAFAAALIGEE